MSRVISQDLQASGVAQVIVVLKQPPGGAGAGAGAAAGVGAGAPTRGLRRGGGGPRCRASSATSATPS